MPSFPSPPPPGPARMNLRGGPTPILPSSLMRLCVLDPCDCVEPHVLSRQAVRPSLTGTACPLLQ